MEAYCVIGAGFGDEGKGLMTDFLVRKHHANMVARFNGGAQAGHTVTTADNRSHIFGHLSAGSLAGASTILGERFIFCARLLQQERGTLEREFGLKPTVFVHEHAPVTTAMDIAVNRLLEQARGDARHGSCGLGIHETLVRHNYSPLTVRDIHDLSTSQLYQLLVELQETWYAQRPNDLELSKDAKESQVGAVLTMTETILAQAAELKKAVDSVKIYAHNTLQTIARTIGVFPLIMEGAQGLMLDEELGSFPHVTHSKTGLPYALEMAGGLGISKLTPVYTTRCYRTRHGAGPLSHDGEQFCRTAITDLTNTKNDWQGSIRFAPLDLRELEYFIHRDITRALAVDHNIELEAPRLAITCLDQIGRYLSLYDLDGRFITLSVNDAYEFILDRLGFESGYISFGPTADDVIKIED